MNMGLFAVDQIFGHKIEYTYESDLVVGCSWIDFVCTKKTTTNNKNKNKKSAKRINQTIQYHIPHVARIHLLCVAIL